ncbi:uncharacterized protein LOC105694786 [Orussus abietinus]|uniref:uncharacterized protein LOC105694786 n=1 Tax=Orussus abietinus TaxID=222816 RepID=UPI00062560CD|nr:uncharacterized protein LOC105694786 [Orussus abietinus]
MDANRRQGLGHMQKVQPLPATFVRSSLSSVRCRPLFTVGEPRKCINVYVDSAGLLRRYMDITRIVHEYMPRDYITEVLGSRQTRHTFTRSISRGVLRYSTRATTSARLTTLQGTGVFSLWSVVKSA